MTPKKSAGIRELSFEAMLDLARLGTGLEGPSVLYHYTSWGAAFSILRQRRFRAAVHEDTNDRDEFTFADAAITEEARAAYDGARGVLRQALRRFLNEFDKVRPRESRRAHLVCFSQERDDACQWWDYGKRGQGVCIGVRLLGAPEPPMPQLTTGIFPVTYGTDGLRGKIAGWHRTVSASIAHVENPLNQMHVESALQTIWTTALAWAFTTKALKWESESEIRMLLYKRKGATLEPPLSAKRDDGSSYRFFEMQVAGDGHLPLDELILGPNVSGHDLDEARHQLAALSYRDPRLNRSRHEPLTSRPAHCGGRK